MTKRFFLILSTIISLCFLICADAAQVNWNGHTYQTVEGSFSYAEAKSAAQEAHGFLATIESDAEAAVLQSLLSNTSQSYWLGGEVVDGVPTWVQSGIPMAQKGDFFWTGTVGTGTYVTGNEWLGGDGQRMGYIIEKYDCYSVATFLHDGYVYSLYDEVVAYEKAQSLAASFHGTLANADAALLAVLAEKLLPEGEMDGYRLADGTVLFKDGSLKDTKYGNIGFVTAVATKLSIADGFVEHNGSIFYRVDTPLTPQDANAVAHYYGGRLASPLSRATQDTWAALFQGAPYATYWVGGGDFGQETIFRRTDGEVMTPLSDYFWNSYQPNNGYGLDDFLVINTQSNTLDDIAISPHYGTFVDCGFILEIPPMHRAEHAHVFGNYIYMGYDGVNRYRGEAVANETGGTLVSKEEGFASLQKLQSISEKHVVWLKEDGAVYTEDTVSSMDSTENATAFVAHDAIFTAEAYAEDEENIYVAYGTDAVEAVAKAYSEELGGTLAVLDTDEKYQLIKNLVSKGNCDKYYFGGGRGVVLEKTEAPENGNRFSYAMATDGKSYRTHGLNRYGVVLAIPKDKQGVTVKSDAYMTTKNGMEAVYRVMNTTADAMDAYILLAVYDEGGRMLDVVSDRALVSAYEMKAFAKEIPVTGGKEVRLMLLKSVATLKPCIPTQAEKETVFVDQNQEHIAYVDLSLTTKSTAVGSTAPITRRTKGEFMHAGHTLVFEKGNNLFTLGPINISDSYIIDAVNDASCGYVTHNGKSAFKIAKNSENQAGFLVTLMSPLAVEDVSNMTLTFMSDSDAPNSSARVMRSDASQNSAMVNKYGEVSLGGATEDWKTIDLLVENLNTLTDDKGQIRSFKFYVRDKNATNFYIRSISFENSPEAYSRVTLKGNDIRYASGALQAVADAIEEKLNAASLQMEFTVSLVSYTPNTSAADGSIIYNVTFVDGERELNYTNLTTTVPKLTKAWLDTEGAYGASHQSHQQLHTNFSPSGILTLTDNTLTCPEGLKGMEYAVVPLGTDYQDASIEWHTPQAVTVNASAQASMFVNAFMDYGDTLKQGEVYVFLVRGVSKNNNYILHLATEFSYVSHHEGAQEILLAAKKRLEQLPSFVLTEANAKAASTHIQKVLTETVNDTDVAVHFTPGTLGHSGFIYEVALTLKSGTATHELPYYMAGGKTRTDFYGCGGDAFRLKNQIAWLNTDAMDAEITLLAPTDGTDDIVLANPETWGYMNEPFTDTLVGKFSDTVTENTHPVPITFSWEGEKDTVYRLEIDTDLQFSSPWQFEVTGTTIDIYNLCVDTVYYWRVTSGTEASPIYRFRTAGNQPRLIYAPGVLNVRDTGGWITSDGKRVKQGLFFRSAMLDNITEEGLYQLRDVLGIKTDLDLRNVGGKSPLGADIKMIACPMKWYTGIFNDAAAKEATRVAISAFAYKENYPLVYHCSLGRDRTGTVAILILSLLGVEQETLHREYMLTMFSSVGGEADKIAALNPNFYGLLDGLKKYKSSSLSLRENTQEYLLDCGVTASEIASIKKLLLEDVTITFNDRENGYALSAINIPYNNTKIVDSVNDASCGYVKKYGMDAYKISANTIGRSGFTITLDRPLRASSFSKMYITYTSDADGASSSARVLPATATEHHQMCNDYRESLMTGGTEKFVTMDVLVNDFAAMADSDGYIRKFKFYIRDTVDTDYYIQSITLK